MKSPPSSRSQTDAACLTAEDINWNTCTISYCRKKLKSRAGVKPALIRFGDEVAAILPISDRRGLPDRRGHQLEYLHHLLLPQEAEVPRRSQAGSDPLWR